MQQMDELEWSMVSETLSKVENTKSENTADKKHDIPNEAIDKLAKGLVSLYLTDLEQVSQSLGELRQNQNILIETIQQENEKYTECQNAFDLNNMFARMKLYHTKLLNIKKEMKIIHDKSQKLKVRANKLKVQKEEEIIQKSIKQQQEFEKEMKIVAKPISTANSNPQEHPSS